jgi:hypothetical protein
VDKEGESDVHKGRGGFGGATGVEMEFWGGLMVRARGRRFWAGRAGVELGAGKACRFGCGVGVGGDWG